MPKGNWISQEKRTGSKTYEKNIRTAATGKLLIAEGCE